MADITQINLNGTAYDIADTTARTTAESAKTTATSAQSTANTAKTTADSAKTTADLALDGAYDIKYSNKILTFTKKEVE